ncbi:hypothetical protein L2E82_47006 [Cichorium intybus]|uniref:Uncharacterized protein n=1 Tax=Cichorium intybus TaxID=13427 RepID=A0ACB8YVB7_CICIN|nr:hypothetical protein L2E82_47006 [Cichorium intybus]
MLSELKMKDICMTLAASGGIKTVVAKIPLFKELFIQSNGFLNHRRLPVLSSPPTPSATCTLIPLHVAVAEASCS